VQAVVGSQAVGYRHTVICYWRPAGEWFRSYSRMELEVARPELADTVARLLRGEGLERQAGDDVDSDLLLCTHGTRDRCCAKLGGGLFRDLSECLPAGARLWRTSHTGGHRFAPTAISLPDGLMWAGLDLDLALGVLRRDLSNEQIERHLRGCTGIGDGLRQAADAAAFARHGWSWLQLERRATVVEDDGSRAEVEITFHNGTPTATMRAIVERGRTLPIALCGEPIEAAVKTTTELRVRDLR
jgi:hypothetical protein